MADHYHQMNTWMLVLMTYDILKVKYFLLPSLEFAFVSLFTIIC